MNGSADYGLLEKLHTFCRLFGLQLKDEYMRQCNQVNSVVKELLYLSKKGIALDLPYSHDLSRLILMTSEQFQKCQCFLQMLSNLNSIDISVYNEMQEAIVQEEIETLGTEILMYYKKLNNHFYGKS